MLILTRKASETIVINDEIRITVLAIKGNQVRLGIEAPQTVEVHREEIYQRIHNQNNAAETNSENEKEETDIATLAIQKMS